MFYNEMKTITAITDALKTSLSTVEVLPGTIDQWQTDLAIPFLLVDGHLGLPQKLLYKLLPCALSLLKQFRLSSSRSSPSSQETASLLEASSIILLANPAHQTALNQRKRLILAAHWSVKQELDFSTLLLSSSREASKQSILWDHRRWLFQTEYIHNRDHPRLIPAPLLEKELGVILRGCESYPRNYYAWAHWEYCLDKLYEGCAKDEGDYFPIVTRASNQLLRWMEHHLSDYSAAHHLCRLVHRFYGLTKTHEEMSDVDLSFDQLSKQAISLLSRYADHEALWMYLRASWAVGGDHFHRENLKASIDALPTCKYREQCISWCNLVKQFE
ncbi:MAG: hypothetical protein NXY57DRAFT_930965 [Lentinula lateritia]|nr:MAG: hypothetical protein NXY57DRAFT_930965 [Lentinula lateritia]